MKANACFFVCFILETTGIYSTSFLIWNIFLRKKLTTLELRTTTTFISASLQSWLCSHIRSYVGGLSLEQGNPQRHHDDGNNE